MSLTESSQGVVRRLHFPAPDEEPDNKYDVDDFRTLSAKDAAPEEASKTLSIFAEESSVCFAAYDDESCEVWIEESFASSRRQVPIVVERVVDFLQPTLILVPPTFVKDEQLLTLLQRLAAPDTNVTPASHGIPFQVLRSSFFDAHTCRMMVLQKLLIKSTRNRRRVRRPADRNDPTWSPLRSPPSSAPSPSTPTSTRSLTVPQAFMPMVDLDSTVQIKALGALVSYLRTTAFATDEDGLVPVKDVVCGNLSNCMSLPPSTLKALQIFSTEQHPLLAADGQGQSKEGFSLLTLLNQTSSILGDQRLREWMSKPLVDVDQIAFRQNGVELFLQPSFGNAIAMIKRLLENVGTVDKVLERLDDHVAHTHDLEMLVHSLRTAISIHDVLTERVYWPLRDSLRDDDAEDDSEESDVNRCLSYIEEVLQSFYPEELLYICEAVEAVVDDTGTYVQRPKSIAIRAGFSEELDILREQYGHLDEVMEDIRYDLCIKYPQLREFLEVVYFPQGVGFLIQLVDDERWTLGALPDEFELVYDEEKVKSFKIASLRDLDMRYGDVEACIKDKESLIIAQLEDEILSHTDELDETFGAIADLDCILSFAAVAADGGYVRPDMVPASANCIFISNGRHPLQEIFRGDRFVPNDTEVNSIKRVNIITGPNFSGKTSYARQVGVLVYMAHLGCFIPCDAAQISIVKEILVRFAVLETCRLPQSTFLKDLCQMGAILRLAGPGSLVLIDEFGKGTSPQSGINLLAAAIQHLAESGAKVICTTHFLELFSMGMLKVGENGINALRTTMKLPQSKSDNVSPLFKLEQGVTDSFAGLVCARMAGLREEIIDRAEEYIHQKRAREPLPPDPGIALKEAPFSMNQLTLLRTVVQKDWDLATDMDVQFAKDCLEILKTSDSATSS